MKLGVDELVTLIEEMRLCLCLWVRRVACVPRAQPGPGPWREAPEVLLDESGGLHVARERQKLEGQLGIKKMPEGIDLARRHVPILVRCSD